MTSPTTILRDMRVVLAENVGLKLYKTLSHCVSHAWLMTNHSAVSTVSSHAANPQASKLPFDSGHNCLSIEKQSHWL